MKIVFWGNGNRGVTCLSTLLKKGYEIVCVVTDPNTINQWYDSVTELAKEMRLESISPSNPNDEKIENHLRSFKPDIFILAGYGKIIRQNIIDIPKIMCINLHAGKLPEYRGSSPMNWALINGETEFYLSVIKLDKGVDTGDILLDKKYSINENDTINDLHKIANENFPDLLVKTLEKVSEGKITGIIQNNADAGYYHLRRPDDGFIAWELLTAREINNRIRALTEPYPCAYTYLKRRKVKLIKSKLHDGKYIGEPGRIFRISNLNGLLVGTKDRCLWIKKAVFSDNELTILDEINIYDRFARLSDIFTDGYG